jgi:DNA-binding transcriptional regulator YiaG
MSLQDDVARLTAIVTRLHQPGGPASAMRLRIAAGESYSAVGTVCGVPGETVQMWEGGQASPTPGQALAWLSHVHEAAGWRAGVTQ